jgi:RNA polymerase sigma factor (sigma-70 family)
MPAGPDRSPVMHAIEVPDKPVYPAFVMGEGSAEDPEALVRRAEAGDRSAWEELVAQHDRRVVVSLLARRVPIDRARDLAQETWARLWAQHQAGKLARLELPGLAVRQAAFLAMEETRRQARTRAEGLEQASDVPDAAALSDVALASKQEVERALREIERLPPRARQIFQIFTEVYTEPETPHAEAAGRLGLSVQRLRQTLCEVRARLRTVLEDSDE